MQTETMTREERYDLGATVHKALFESSSFSYQYTSSDEEVIQYCRSYIYSFLYRMIESSLPKKEFSFYKYNDSEMKKIMNDIDLCDLVDSTIIDLKHYLAHIEQYCDEDSVYFELDRLNDDYLSITKIPELNSKKYIREKVKHMAELLPELEKRIGLFLYKDAGVHFNISGYSEKQMVFFDREPVPLKDVFEYITPVATDKAVLAKMEKELFLKNIKKVRIEVLNAQIELERFLNLNCLKQFLKDEEIKKIKSFKNFFDNFNEKQYDLFGTEKLGYNDYRNSSRW